MTETDDKQDGQQAELARPRRLELKKTVETGQVRQSFAHGRSKMVTVEVRKKRTFATDSRGRVAEIQRDAERGAGGRGGADGHQRPALTNTEKAARARALEEARRAEEERVIPVEIEEEQPPVEIVEPVREVAADATVAVPPAEDVVGKPETVPLAETEVEPEAPVVPSEAKPEAVSEPGAVPPEPKAAAPAGAPVRPDGEVKAKSADGGALRADGKQAAKKAETAAEAASRAASKLRVAVPEEEEVGARGKVRRAGRGDGRRAEDVVSRERGGRISIVDALDDADERVRSLASVRRARQKERLKQIEAAKAEPPQKVIRDVVIPERITVQELANRMAERSADVIKALMKMGLMVTINHVIDTDTAELIATEFGHNVKRVSEADVEIGLRGSEDDDAQLAPRPPVVTIMGHVDHGKTSMLDALRKTDVAGHEAGGITQHIGAYQVTLAGGAKVTFLDTPGHEAFTQMRARGAKATDIVVLVVAADDGVMPQTIEAIAHAKAADVPMIVAINKMDRPDANPQRVRTELLQHGVFVEDMGGETLSVEVSAKTGAGLDKLIEAILLQAEVLDLRANADRPAEGVIIESKMERGRGPVATVLVQRGSLKVGDVFVAGSEWGRVRSLTDAGGASVEVAGPGMPVEVLGLDGPPAAGDDVIVVEGEARAREVSEFRQRRLRDARTTSTRGSLEQMMSRIREGDARELPVVVKADVHGSVEAIVGALQKMGREQIKVSVLHAGVGGINETDVGLARATGALIIGFNVRANPQARELAKRDGVEIRYYSIIYDLTDDIRAVLSGMLAPTLKENILGYAEIRQVFSVSKVGKVAGCRVTEGIVRRGARVRLLRDNVVIHEGDIAQLKHFKEDVREVKEGYECGIALASYHDIQAGDLIECFDVEKIAQQL